ncbi:hypothetical protein RJO15_26355 [Herbaspirillum huttiense F1]|uniref:hypothetical protein n=1 Tax=Herbaspirillum huttiense TaxID=863372 RepID=UPI002888287E|nr:hypothetical protein [Herbaspirillum huttiense]MDT0359334.1 hypothetical protein [Herbaspirillum huttiense F1]
MTPLFKKKILGALINESFSSHYRSQIGLLKLLKVRKCGPFTLPGMKEENHYFCHILANVIASLSELPDFSDDRKIAVLSDYGGEHQEARYSTYSFLFVTLDKNGPFQAQMESLRARHNIHTPYSEFKYKDLKFGPRSRALADYLNLIDNFIHGAVVTVAIDKKIGSVFGTSKHEAHRGIEEQLHAAGFGRWTGQVGEKVLRVLHILSAFTAALTHDQQRLLWYSDTDQINEDAHDRTFADTQKMFSSIAAMYMTHGFEILGFGKSFSEKGYLDDLLSIPDFAAGMLQDLLTAEASGSDIPGGSEKLALLKWLATPSRFLSKIHLKILSKEDGTYVGEVLSLNLK